ncbi:putative bifunctional diguanylate cyclase/phosphodiesterase [Anaerocolumna xylanovorans]|uniref:Diguanylate cyclase (GGDEF) domain-containing protein n=1 Tax=Anaerocolumna xylanovorans DSM 12503 TaxID=1121345 RepID=A0A1M7YMI1_9FIRM|nr:EAL domain-containing protein [Anaerocolumna xylanovorans]SHO53736.1 diguanylate cyclase (GGDEF) domain-containing protein [Anaerocolumna xylanovorans DSM 12503]
MLNAMINLESQGEDKKYIIPYLTGNIFFIVAGIGILLLIVFAILHYKKSRAYKALVGQKEELAEEYHILEASYEEAVNTRNQYQAKNEELKKSNEKLKKTAYTDLLTQLPNHYALTELLDNIMLTLRNEEVVALMYIDVDDFKQITDSLGHSYGDELLIDITHRLKQSIDENDFLSRLGSDEFVILTQNFTDIGEYEDKIKKILKVFEYPFVLSLKEYFVTVSIGIAMAPKDGKTAQVLLKSADTAMYSAKITGKNTFAYFKPAMNDRIMEKIQNQAELRRAIEKKEFVVYYQPQIDLKTDKITGFEARVRWEHSERGILKPAEFIKLSEETGLIVPIGMIVIEEALKKLKEWQDKGYKDLTISINISVRQLKDNDFYHKVKDLIEQIGVNAASIELEITESVALQESEHARYVIEALNELGISFALDDFGTGYSSMNYLKIYPISNIKMDKSFLDTLFTDDFNKSIIESTIALVQSMNLTVTAEGIESCEQEQFLKSVRCNKAQGYLYSEALPADQAEAFLLSNR